MRLRSRLLWLASPLLLLPLLAWVGVHQVHQFLLQGQEAAQRLTAEGLAALLGERPRLLDRPRSVTAASLLRAWPTDRYLLLDGYDGDWPERIPLEPLGQSGPEGSPSLAWSIRLAQRQDQLFGWLEVADDEVRTARPDDPGGVHADHLRLAFRSQGRTRRFLVLAETSGAARVRAADADWQPMTEASPPPLHAYWRSLEGGYRIEWRLPLSLLADDARLWMALMDVDEGRTRLVPASDHRGRPVHLHSPELQQLVGDLGEPGRHIWVLDAAGEVRAVANLADATPGLLQRLQTGISRVLQGESLRLDYRTQGEERILVAEPVTAAQGEVVGAVLVEVATREVLDLRRSTLLKTGALTLAILAFLLLGFMGFGARLTGRIEYLAGVIRQSLDDRGRVPASAPPVPAEGDDELAALARDFARMRTRLTSAIGYLERMPRILRHELSNPLNTLATSVEMMAEAETAAEQERYRQSAERGIRRLALLLEGLTEAASLEEAVAGDPRHRLDCVAMLERYCAQRQPQLASRRLRLVAETSEVQVLAPELRLEQALDNLLANACDFAPAASELILRVRRLESDRVEISLENQGPWIPEALLETLFESLVSSRHAEGSETPHLGLGLYLVRLVAENLGGGVTAANIPGGVRVGFWLPLAGGSPAA